MHNARVLLNRRAKGLGDCRFALWPLQGSALAEAGACQKKLVAAVLGTRLWAQESPAEALKQVPPRTPPASSASDQNAYATGWNNFSGRLHARIKHDCGLHTKSSLTINATDIS